jgi:hypothetical protein
VDEQRGMECMLWWPQALLRERTCSAFVCKGVSTLSFIPHNTTAVGWATALLKGVGLLFCPFKSAVTQ